MSWDVDVVYWVLKGYTIRDLATLWQRPEAEREDALRLALRRSAA